MSDRLLAALSCANLAVHAAGPDVRDLTLHESLNAAIQDAIAEARTERRQTFFPVAIWKDKDLGRGVVLATFRRNHPVHGDCQEFAVSFITDEEKPVYADFGRTACRQNAAGPYVIRPEVPVEIDEPRRQRARSFLPPATLAPGSIWRILNVEQRLAHSHAAAIGMALYSSPVPGTTLWEGPESRGALLMYDSKGSPGCRKLISRASPPSPGGRQFSAEYCPYRDGPVVGWIRTISRPAPPAEQNVAEPFLDQAIRAARWSDITQFPM